MANTYLTRTPSSTGNRKKWTYSAWIKNTSGSNYERLYESDGDNEYFRFNDTKKLFFRTNNGSNGGFTTARVFRDTNAWYHIVLRVDTTLGTAGDRIRLYVNGVEETVFDTETQVAQNYDTYSNYATKVIKIGSSNFDGCMSHIHFADGSSLAPTVFGSVDSVTGEWKINTAPSFTPGTNGFTILKDGNTITDQSANSNNFSLGAGTLTNTKDCPSNVLATLNTLERLRSNITISNGNTQFFNQASDWGVMISNLAFPNTGKFYAEMQVNEVSSAVQAGIMAQLSFNTAYQSDLGTQGAYNSYAYLNTGQKRTNGSATNYGNSFSGGVIGIAVDMDNKNIYFSKDGTYQNSGNPASGSTGTGAAFTDLQNDKDYCFAVASQGSNPKVSWNFGNGFFGTTAITTNSGNGYAGAEGASKFNYQPPSGYSALSTKGLNQ